jgi:cell division protein FtsN
VEFTPDAMLAVSQLSGGLPRVINLLCDRALEDAFTSRRRTIDGGSIQAAASALGVGGAAAPAIAATGQARQAATTPLAGEVTAGKHVPAAAPATEALAIAPKLLEEAAPPQAADGPAPQIDTSFWNVRRPEPHAAAKAVQPEEALADPVAAARAGRTPRLAMSLVLAGTVAFGAVGIWLAIRAARPPEAAPPPAQAPAATAPLVLSPRPDSPPPAATSSVPAPAATTAAPPPQAAPPVVPAPVEPSPAAGTAGRFDIVVASFRTELRASSVANEVATLGLPIRRRMSDGWHQVISGPFATRLDAEDAQRRLDRAGLTGTQITPSAR